MTPLIASLCLILTVMSTRGAPVPTILLGNSTLTLPVLMPDGSINSSFLGGNIAKLSCKMPSLFIFGDADPHSGFPITTTNAKILSVSGKYRDASMKVICDSNNNCQGIIHNGCPLDNKDKNEMNWVTVQVQTDSYLDQFEYLVDCDPYDFYKPFQWGLFLLICFCTIAITAASLYSRAWAYQGFGINVNVVFICVFNFLVILGSILAYFAPTFVSYFLKVLGSMLGIVGVMICTAETLWLLKSAKLNKPILFEIVRPLDIISFLMGCVLTGLYWGTGGVWFVNDILAVCMIVAGIKIFKIRSLAMGIFMLFTLLLIQIVAGLIVHYLLKVSYNNLIIQMFQSPLVIVFPSITPEFYRKCAWLPVTNIIFPGLFISYLRRFDKSKGTCLYLIIGYVSFYIGSILWMLADLATEHTLPLAIIADPITAAVVIFFAFRRNQLRTIWEGLIYDPEIPDFSENMLAGSDRESHYIAFKDMTQNLKIDSHIKGDSNSSGFEFSDGEIPTNKPTGEI